MIMSDKLLQILVLSFGVWLISLLTCESASALPWDRDMYSQESLKSNEIARAPAQGTVPVGRNIPKYKLEDYDSLTNPVYFEQDSIWRGQRLYNINCLPCHGAKGAGDGIVGQKMAAPNLLTDTYKSRTDGKIYGVIRNGLINMPRYGFKFSEEETWSVVNYLRHLQGKHVNGVELGE